jgi:hypothetical protein
MNKKQLIWVGAIAVVGIAYYLYTKKKAAPAQTAAAATPTTTSFTGYSTAQESKFKKATGDGKLTLAKIGLKK